ncbi:inorganic phosphate transporter [Luteipulveratus mongoliensis]|uniref:Phosphate transporter n=1 Tax=Luteipulveratus mongoliensis TaxID=571913 RepID=A0A0K1JK75_9MICO|nr:inorganic phosphate transporter [Luteipulveratus mongoliensis]AKU17122.1 hypothetical protein VV02_16735 [Luteipulveratus mongoliensis]
MTDAGVIVLAAAFAVATGLNDGGSLLSTGLKVPSVRPLYAVLILTACTALVPWLSSKVAASLAHRLVAFEGPNARTAVVVAVISAIVLVLGLTSLGQPTSLTLALVGGLTGAGMGFGLEVSWPFAVRVLVVGACAPVVGCVLAFLISRWLRLLPARPALNGAVYRSHRLAFAMQCVAYASNDGQKVLAVFAVLGLATVGAAGPSPVLLMAIGLFFGVGVVLGLPRVARGLSNGVLLVRPVHAVAAEFASAIAVLGSAAIGVPVSMTQSIAGGLIGTGLGHGSRRIRWNEVGRIGAAWIVTLPASCLLSAVTSMSIRRFAS